MLCNITVVCSDTYCCTPKFAHLILFLIDWCLPIRLLISRVKLPNFIHSYQVISFHLHMWLCDHPSTSYTLWSHWFKGFSTMMVNMIEPDDSLGLGSISQI